MNQKSLEIKYEQGPKRIWFTAESQYMSSNPFRLKCDEIWLYQTEESRVLIRANSIINNSVTEYIGDVERTHGGFKIGAPLLHANDLDHLKELCEKEIALIETIVIPNRDLDSLYQTQEQDTPSRLSKVD